MVTFNLSRRLRRYIFAALAIVLMGAVFFITTFLLNNSQNAVRGVFVAGMELSELSRQQAEENLNNKIETYKNTSLVVQNQKGTQVTTTPAELGVQFMAQKTLDNAYAFARTENIAQRMLRQAKALVLGVNIAVEAEINPETFEYFVKNKLVVMHSPAKNASFEYNSGQNEFVLVPPRDGDVVDLQELQNKIIKNANMLSESTIAIDQNLDKPMVAEHNLGNAKEEAQNILAAGPYKIKALEQEWQIEQEDIIEWLVFEPRLNESTQTYELSVAIDEQQIKNYLERFAGGLNVKPVNAQFTIENGKVKAFSLSKDGQELDAPSSAKIVAKTILDKQEQAILVFNETPAEITSENIDTLGIEDLLGRGESDFAGSPSSRVHNIITGSNKYQGVLIGPGEDFSFNQNLGPVTAAAGYRPELVIKQGRTVPEYGGGLCQVSTTLFRAALNSGLDITKRSNHSYPVHYYGTPGLDATIYPPNPDLAFKNTTDNHMLVQYKIVGTKLIFELYGRDDGRYVEIDGPHLYDRRANGAVKAWVKQTVYNKEGNVIHEETFYSNYKSPALYPVIRNPLE